MVFIFGLILGHRCSSLLTFNLLSSLHVLCFFAHRKFIFTHISNALFTLMLNKYMTTRMMQLLTNGHVAESYGICSCIINLKLEILIANP